MFFSQDVVLSAELEQVYRQHRQALFSLALAITGCAGLAEDAVHDAFVGLCGMQKLPSGHLAAYVYAAVRNSAVDCCRRAKRELLLAGTLFTDTPNLGVANIRPALEDVSARLRHEIELLDEGTREIIVMKIYGELTFDEIGTVLDTPPATVATRYRRALLAMEEKLRRDS